MPRFPVALVVIAVSLISAAAAAAEPDVLKRAPDTVLGVETTTISGWKRNENRTGVSVGGGGSLKYGQVRNVMEQATAAAGWNFHLDGGRMP